MDDQKEKPFFAWVHLYDAHTPYSPPEPFRSEYGSSGLVGLYDGEIAFVDEQIGRCLSWLDKKNLREKTIVAVIGDHGEGLGDHGELTHGYFIYDYAVHVPFILSTGQ
jgi:arylsulfatase A-like enzyme